MDWSRRHVVVTGSSGFLGSAVLRTLVARGVRPEAMTLPRSAQCDLREASAARALLDRAAEKLRSRANAADGAAPSGSSAPRGPTAGAAGATQGSDELVVIHCAGLVGGLGLNRARPADMLRDNLLMGLNVIDAAARLDSRETTPPAPRQGPPGPSVRVVIVGSMTSYPADAPLPYREESLFGGLPDKEIAPYGLSKLGLLAALNAYRAQFGLRSVCPILVNLYGPGDNIDDPLRSHAAGAIMKRFVDAARSGTPEVVCWGTGSPTRDFLYVDDAAEGVVRAAEGVVDGSPINIASGNETSIRVLSETIARLAGYTGRIVWDASKGDGVSRRCLDVSRARQMLGWSAQMPLEEGLRRTINWYRTRDAGKTA